MVLPPLLALAPGHWVACIRAEELGESPLFGMG